MRGEVASRIMPRTTLDIDATVLAELRERASRDGKSMGQVASELLAVALAEPTPASPAKPLEWKTWNMGLPLVDLEDKHAVWAILDADDDEE
jgi:hypothetical protein